MTIWCVSLLRSAGVPATPGDEGKAEDHLQQKREVTNEAVGIAITA